VKHCEEITLDLERANFERLSLMNRMEIRMHVAICPHCRKYFKDSKTLDKWLAKRFRHKSENITFTPEEKEAMKKAIKD